MVSFDNIIKSKDQVKLVLVESGTNIVKGMNGWKRKTQDQSTHACNNGSGQWAGSFRREEHRKPPKAKDRHLVLDIWMRCSVLCLDHTLMNSWTMPALRMSYICTSRSQWATYIRGIHSSGGERKWCCRLLATQARKFLCSPPSYAPGEHVFDEVPAVSCERNRSRLTWEHAERLCFLHHTIWCCWTGITDWAKGLWEKNINSNAVY